jgi:hypothetical protein
MQCAGKIAPPRTILSHVLPRLARSLRPRAQRKLRSASILFGVARPQFISLDESHDIDTARIRDSV